MRTLKGYIGTINYDKKTGSRTVETVSEKEFTERREYRREKDRIIRQKIEAEKKQQRDNKNNNNKKKKEIKKGYMDGQWMKKIYGQ